MRACVCICVCGIVGLEGKRCKALVMPNVFLGLGSPADQVWGCGPRRSHRLLRAEYRLSGVTSALRKEVGQLLSRLGWNILLWRRCKLETIYSIIRVKKIKAKKILARSPDSEFCSFKKLGLDFPGGPGVKTLHSQSRRHGFDPWPGN